VNALKKGYYILRYLGPRIVWLRAGVYLSKGTGRARRAFRARPWERIDLARITRPGTPADPRSYASFKREQAVPFLFPLGQPPPVPAHMRGVGERQPALAERLRLLEQGRCVYFCRWPAPGPVDWYANPFDGHRSAARGVWCDIPDYLPEQGDPRMLWEPARAAWAIDLARARSHGLGEGAGRLYWRWVDSFMEACPPFRGFQWKCGQEAAVRLIAVALGFWSLAEDPETTPARWVQFARLAWATGYRIARHMNYAISQKNNHAISEACGLLLVSHLFPEFLQAGSWRDKARRVLARELRRQVYADGSYVQHSMNYQRVMMAGALLGLRLAELEGEPFGRDIYEPLGRCGEFLFQMMEPASGRLPEYGNNDGAHVLPLNECDFADYRPVIQATHYLVHRRRVLPAGPWDEDLLWLFGPEALAGPAPGPLRAKSTACDVGGYYTLRQAGSWAMVRCHTYRDRPGQYDPLQLDLWYRGENVVRDCGTYRYYVPGRPDVERYFKSSAAHNIVEIDGTPPVEFVSRFLFFPWPRCFRRHFQAAPGLVYFEGEHRDYDRVPWHALVRRSVSGLPDDVWIVVDDVMGEGEHQVVLRWHFADVAYDLDAARVGVGLHTAAGLFQVRVSAGSALPQRVEVVRGRDEPGRVQGFAAPYYGQRQAIPTLEVEYSARLPLRIVTALGPGVSAVSRREAAGERERWEVAGPDGGWALTLAAPARSAPRTLLECTPRSGAARSPAGTTG